MAADDGAESAVALPDRGGGRRRNVRYTVIGNGRYKEASDMEWLILTYRLPGEPSRHRVAVWRELRRAGALALQQATWAVPARPPFLDAVGRATELVEQAGGDALVIRGRPDGEETPSRLEELFTAAREEGWGEFLRECRKFDAEIDHEVATGKLTAAELDEEEQNLGRLRRWFRELRGRDVFIAPSAGEAEDALKACAERLEDFADRVYRMDEPNVGTGGKERTS
jgi:hypothetical protein